MVYRAFGDVSGTIRPWQGGLETIYEVVETPGYDGVIIQPHPERHHGTGDTYTPQIRGDLVPCSNGSLAQALSYD